ncbi:chromosome partitioning protein, ParB family [Desulfatibacillum alkenivorans DSM 16219]|jgi:ParB family chromosome partitioning protein|uniref:Chromosome partitioning protein, ParB family n=1 Tax=Desulfatibacillum alkenivorans DSM 16219 TaxID=1121393 RepID=A0A1M7AZL8_9BACT|nr:ParB/RepB/Spo0J family partition protein [Desulfatibacillum alkenivorans]SHL48175.1 chromosome partitioning protein, ParB family [Desulfatibacillum alkenivorans DSM 16219]
MKKTDSTKKTKRNVLGRGLDAFLPDVPVEAKESPENFFECDVDDIVPNQFQPRTIFSQEELAELSESIAEQGVIQPLVVRKNQQELFELIAGERRLRASKMAGLSRVPVIVVEASDEKVLQMTIVENIQRENLNPLEECQAYHRLMEECSLTQEEVAKRVGKKRSTVANFLRLKNLPRLIQDGIRENVISMGHARAILGLEESSDQLTAYRETVKKALSVRATESLVNRLKKAKDAKPKPTELDSNAIYMNHLCEELSRQLGAKVEISKNGKRGALKIEFYSEQDLDRLVTLLKNA